MMNSNYYEYEDHTCITFSGVYDEQHPVPKHNHEGYSSGF